jgi:hypothetical protein
MYLCYLQTYLSVIVISNDEKIEGGLEQPGPSAINPPEDQWIKYIPNSNIIRLTL